MSHYKVAIIGAGPAGISCAIQLKRYGIESILFEKNQVGGLLTNANHIENYLGFENGIPGADLVNIFKKTLDNSGIKPLITEVKNVSYIQNTFHIDTENGLFTSEILVVASGTKPKKLNSNNSSKLFYEIADLPEKNYPGKKFAIIGAGDAAFDYALNLSNNYNITGVYILNRNPKAKCLPVLEEKALRTSKISHIKNITVNGIEIVNNEAVLSCVIDNNTLKFKVDYVLSAIGREPNTDFLSEELETKSQDLQNNRLLYFIGDVSNGNYRQISIATGDGIRTAMKIYLNY